ncbi:hypothetical protein QNM97_13645 [Gordonia sp. L191]|uniref:DUF7427 family protein n=1 Tax=Gordonia sp. L191 TaxID=2982699 RepID=UPI0024C08C48|nr:hypothetical protein [Gordonia sp. L191]WHU45094.1 hypothetical protein QNM97_13645 [Gordonia sp. L191]
MKYLPPERAWALIAAFVVAYDLACHRGQTLSEEADRWTRAHPVLARAGILAVALHVANVVPDRLDPLHRIAAMLPKTDCAV